MSSIAEVEGFVDALIKEYKLCDDLRGNLLISLTEAVTNAIRHGNGLDADKAVSVEVWRRASDLKVLVSDEGAGFEPASLPDPTCLEFLEQEGGRGVFLMRALSDDIKFHCSGRSVEMCYECATKVTRVVAVPKVTASRQSFVAVA